MWDSFAERKRSMTNEYKEAIAKFRRGNYVVYTYRWLIEVALLFAAFTEFPTHKWSIGLALLVFNGGISAMGRGVVTIHTIALAQNDKEHRRTRHAILLAAEYKDRDKIEIDQVAFWDEVAIRVDQEIEKVDIRRRASQRLGELETPAGFWKGTLLALLALVWELVASLFGIGLVAVLTN
jgi:hypothetical protein